MKSSQHSSRGPRKLSRNNSHLIHRCTWKGNSPKLNFRYTELVKSSTNE
jgi:hypothetical protein